MGWGGKKLGNKVQDTGKNHRMNTGKNPIANVQDPMQKKSR